MQVYRITLTKFAGSLQASGKPARWNGNQVKLIYTSSSQSLSCLENVVHRSSLGLNHNFSLLTIYIPDTIEITEIKLQDLPNTWQNYEQFPVTQEIGNQWVLKNLTAILKVPSAIIPNEYNYLLNPNHHSFSQIDLRSSKPFIFDSRIKI